MTTHTPGPWTVDKRYPVAYSVRNDGNSEIARLELTSLYAYNEPQRDANAALIAASPTMYDYIYKQARRGDIEAQAILKTLD